MADQPENHSLVESIKLSSPQKSPEERDRLLRLMTSAASPDRETRRLAAFRLGFIKDAEPTVEELLKALLDDEAIRLDAAFSAMRVSDRCKDNLAGQLVPIFLDAAVREQGVVRLWVLQCLGRFAKFADAILPTLTDALGSDDLEVRYNASNSLARLGVAASPAVEAIRQAVERERECLTRSGGVIDLRLIHATTLFKIAGSNALSREVAIEKLRDVNAPENVRYWAQVLLDGADTPEQT